MTASLNPADALANFASVFDGYVRDDIAGYLNWGEAVALAACFAAAGDHAAAHDMLTAWRDQESDWEHFEPENRKPYEAIIALYAARVPADAPESTTTTEGN